MPAVKNVGEPCAGEPHARIEVAAGGNQASRASTCRAAQAPLADPTVTATAVLCGHRRPCRAATYTRSSSLTLRLNGGDRDRGKCVTS